MVTKFQGRCGDQVLPMQGCLRLLVQAGKNAGQLFVRLQAWNGALVVNYRGAAELTAIGYSKT
jgi:hypothetical protein